MTSHLNSLNTIKDHDIYDVGNTGPDVRQAQTNVAGFNRLMGCKSELYTFIFNIFTSLTPTLNNQNHLRWFSLESFHSICLMH